MNKLVILKLEKGNFENGFPVTLEIGDDNARPNTVISATLPPAPEIPKLYSNWQSAYRALNLLFRMMRKEKQVKNVSIIGDCRDAALILSNNLNLWLESLEFRPIKECLLKNLNSQSEIRVIIQTKDIQIRQLPWHLWKLFLNDYPKAEIAFSPLEYQKVEQPQPDIIKNQVRILVVLGGNTDINVQKDLELLQKRLPNAYILPLINPQKEELSNELWEQNWDILFFAGHSESQGESEGKFDISETESLTIAELQYALKKAIAHGLQLAIFNSCNGLGLASALEDLQLTACIVMRERIPDEAAQKFLEYFLKAFGEDGKSLYLSVRISRERLHSFENKYPCASWLPVICENPFSQRLTWQKLGGIARCPYQGLSAFQEEDAPLFFGRKAFTQQLVEAVNTKKLVAVIGPSGSGKSSVVFAGLIPSLRQQATPELPLKVATFRPGNNPFDALAVALLSVQPTQTPDLTTRQLQQNQDYLYKFIQSIVQQGNGTRLLLVADQFEELYTLVTSEERLAFLDRLLRAVNNTPGFTLVLTLRADFLGRALDCELFGKALQQYPPELLIPMNREELSQAIALPAQKLEVELEPGLIERIINNVSQQPGKLPLLEFALTQMWAKQIQGKLTHKAYEEIGGVSQSLANHAEQVYIKLNETDQKRAQKIFIQLVHPGEGTEDTRRLATRAEVGSDNWDLVTQLASARLTVTGRDGKNLETVEIVHEELIRSWRELRLWIEQDRDFRSWQERLRMAMHLWETKHNCDEGALLRGAPLTEAETWLIKRQEELTQQEKIFIQQSLELRDREKQEKERQQQQTISLLASGLVTAVMLAGIAGWQWQRAEFQKRQIEIAAASASSSALLLSGKQFDALLESLRAATKLQNFDSKSDVGILVAATLQQALYNIRERNRLEGHSGNIMSVAWSPDGQTIASASFDQTVKLWRHDGTLWETLKGHSDKVFDVSFSPDGELIATASFDKTVKIWKRDSSDSRYRVWLTLTGHSDRVLGVAWSPDGQTIATASQDKTVKLWKRDGTLIETLQGHSDIVFEVTFSPDNNTVASASWDKTVKLWKLDGTLLDTLAGHQDQVDSVTFSDDGELIATASADEDQTIKLWKRESAGGTYKEYKTLRGHSDTIYSVRFSPDGKILASASKDGTIKLWNREGQLQETFEGHTNSVNSVSFSSDGKTIASGSGDGSVRIWSLAGAMLPILKGDGNPIVDVIFSTDRQQIVTAEKEGKIQIWNRNGQPLGQFLENATSIALSPKVETIVTGDRDGKIKLWNRNGTLHKTLSGHSDRVFDMSFSDNGELIATASFDKTVKIWRSDGTLVRTIPAHNDKVLAVAWSRDGKTLASASGDKTVKLWNTNGELLLAFKEHSDRVLSVAWSPDGQTIASGSQDNTIKLWNLHGAVLHTLKGHNDIVNSVSFSSDGRIVASASEDNTVKLWSINGSLLKTLQGHTQGVNSATFSPEGSTIASAGRDGIVILWNLDLNSLKIQACDWVRDYLQTNPSGQNSSIDVCKI